MKRLIDWHLMTWKEGQRRKPLLLKGARQIGKTYSVRQLGKHFESLVEINFELVPEAKSIFDKDLQPERIVWELGLLTGMTITPGKTLLFLDEVQAAPQAILALRYFYELMPELHVIAAGSLIDFSLEKVGMPVGRVTTLYVYPLSFMEFLAATDNAPFIAAILKQLPLSEILHDKLLDFLGHYLAIGGMPEAVRAWVETKDPRASYEAQKGLVETYRQDFPKYAKRHQLPYLDILFNQIPHFIGKQFKYSAVHGEYKKRELAPCLDLLRRANVLHQITHSAGNGLYSDRLNLSLFEQLQLRQIDPPRRPCQFGNGAPRSEREQSSLRFGFVSSVQKGTNSTDPSIPLGAEVNLDRFKMIFLDVGIAQSLLGLDLAAWFLNPDKDLINRGAIVEAFVGQELLAYASPTSKTELYFWKRESKGALAEIDYLYDSQHLVLPIEVKSGHGSTLRSMHQFLEDHKNSDSGLRFWAENYLKADKIDSRPLYAVATLAHPDQIKALSSLI